MRTCLGGNVPFEAKYLVISLAIGMSVLSIALEKAFDGSDCKGYE